MTENTNVTNKRQLRILDAFLRRTSFDYDYTFNNKRYAIKLLGDICTGLYSSPKEYMKSCLLNVATRVGIKLSTKKAEKIVEDVLKLRRSPDKIAKELYTIVLCRVK